ncbi:FAD-dependent oxidoreductase [Candidatus Microgenomates bacterium]|nr:FAD-dependent oxidoreductase [Candidatus Microgenomates bacterium]
MQVAILGAGFTGLTAALRLLQKGHRVTIFEKENVVGGLASGFREKNWQWDLEKAYHHWFTNDASALSLAKELGITVLIKRPSTDVYIKGRQLPFDSVLSLLVFPYLPIGDRLRTGLTLLFLKMINNYHKFDNQKALPWIKKWMGERSFATIWQPLFRGKFGAYQDEIAMSWFWARIKKRTPGLAYPQGGFGTFSQSIADRIRQLGGKIYLGREVKTGNSFNDKYDKIIITLPNPIFIKLFPRLPKKYVAKISSIQYLHALNLVLILKKPFMKKTYWLNIADSSFPFLVAVEHTNFMDEKYYGGKHIVYIGNYLPKEHRYFKMTKEELLKEFDPFLKRINPVYNLSLINYHFFTGPFAQPVVTLNYQKKMPDFETPVKNVFLANLSMVYPWDRGTNYAIELGEKVVERVLK